MRNKRLRGWLQNAALAALTLSALFQLSRLPSLHNIQWSARVQDLLSSRPADGEPESDGVPAGMFSSVHLMVTADSDYGRCGRLSVPADDPALQSVTSLFGEALGSAGQVGVVADATLRRALDGPGLYLDLTAAGRLPMEAVAVWLGESAEFDRPVQAMALTTGEADTAALYLLDGEGGIYLYDTALPASAVRPVCERFAPNDSRFAYETGYGSLEPYAVLVAETASLPPLLAEKPAGYSAYNLLTALDFNAHTLSRYTESSGAEVVEESPRTLRIGPDGTVEFTSRGESASALYRVKGEDPAAAEYLAAGWRLAAALTDGTGASPLYLRAVEESPEGCVLRFRYQSEGVPIFFSDEGDALAVVFRSGSITAFTYRCRSYTPSDEEAAPMLPAAMAQAIAAIYPEAGLMAGYVDNGSGTLPPQWLAGP